MTNKNVVVVLKGPSYADTVSREIKKRGLDITRRETANIVKDKTI